MAYPDKDLPENSGAILGPDRTALPTVEEVEELEASQKQREGVGA